MGWLILNKDQAAQRTPGGLSVQLRIGAPPSTAPMADSAGLRLRLEHARLRLLRGFEDLLCLEGLNGVEHLPHQIETVRKVLRHFRGRVLLADEVGLGKTIEACLLMREYLLRGLAKRVLILVPPALVFQWRAELAEKFALDVTVADAATARHPDFWTSHERVLASIHLAKSRKNFAGVSEAPWDLVIVDEAHHCKNRETRNWQLVNALRRRHLFLLTATPVQNDLLELYNLLTLLEPGHLRTESEFKKTFVRRGNPRDPRNRARLRDLLGQVMIRNTRGLVNLDLPPRYAQTFVVQPGAEETAAYRLLETYLRWRRPVCKTPSEDPEDSPAAEAGGLLPLGSEDRIAQPAGNGEKGVPPIGRMQLNSLLLAAGSHPATLAESLPRIAGNDSRVMPILERLAAVRRSAKEAKLLDLLQENRKGKILLFANFRVTLERLKLVLGEAGLGHAVFSGDQSAQEKAEAVETFRERVPILLCSESGGEGQNLQFANTLVNFDLPWNPMRIEQRIGRIHRYGQKQRCFVFNLCTKGSMEERILRLLDEKLRMFELVIGEVGSILGNLEGGEEFESLMLDLWIRSGDGQQLDRAFENLGEKLLQAQGAYVEAKELDTALFGDDFE